MLPPPNQNVMVYKAGLLRWDTILRDGVWIQAWIVAVCLEFTFDCLDVPIGADGT